jgi:3-(3-hydroxy-phenyl)propionate hydroxylase
LLGTGVTIETTHRTRYRVHQRVATSFRQGRILLVGDSAHLNNPLGGFGMNSGVHDSMNLADKLCKVILEGAGDELLDLYDRQRRTVTREFVQAQTIANKKAAEETGSQDGSGMSPRERMLARLENDPKARHAYIVEQAMFKSLEREAEIT